MRRSAALLLEHLRCLADAGAKSAQADAWPEALLLYDYATKIYHCFSVGYCRYVRKRQKGLLACSGLLNGIFGSGDERHIACWQALKVVDKTEEEEDGVVTIKEKERFTNELTLVYRTGQTAILK